MITARELGQSRSDHGSHVGRPKTHFLVSVNIDKLFPRNIRIIHGVASLRCLLYSAVSLSRNHVLPCVQPDTRVGTVIGHDGCCAVSGWREPQLGALILRGVKVVTCMG